MLKVAAVAAVAVLAAVALGSWATELGNRGVVRVDDAVALAAAAGGTLVAAWYALTATVLLLVRLAELGRRAPRLARGLRAAVAVVGAPVLRRAAVLGVGAGLALAAVPASAGTDDAVPHDLRPGIGSLADPDPAPAGERPTGEATGQETEAVAESPAPASAPTAATAPKSTPSTTEPPSRPSTGAPAEDRQPSPPPTVEAAEGSGATAGSSTARPGPQAAAGSTAERPAAQAGEPPQAPAGTDAAAHVVRPGDSLWSIAREHLGGEASDAEVAAEWPRWHTTNRAVIGADPHLIHPGQPLLAPDPEEQR